MLKLRVLRVSQFNLKEMSNLNTPGVWPKVTTKQPCPICKQPDWCLLGLRVVRCMRVESSRPCPSGGWYHSYGDKVAKPYTPLAPIRQTPKVDAEKVYNSLHESDHLVSIAAQKLGVSLESLQLLGTRIAGIGLAFPMYNGDGKICGIRYRYPNGDKLTAAGTSNGIFVPYWEWDTKIAFLPEGPTDTAALLSIGLFAIGRPSCQSDARLIAQTLKRMGIWQAVIVADNDELKQLGNSEARPGIVGAQKLKRELGIKSVIWVPPSPCKDSRDFVKRGGTAQMILNDVKQKVWTNK